MLHRDSSDDVILRLILELLYRQSIKGQLLAHNDSILGDFTGIWAHFLNHSSKPYISQAKALWVGVTNSI